MYLFGTSAVFFLFANGGMNVEHGVGGHQDPHDGHAHGHGFFRDGFDAGHDAHRGPVKVGIGLADVGR